MKHIRHCKECSLVATTEEDLNLFVKSPDSKHGRRNLCRVCAGKKTDNSSQRMRDWKTAHQVQKRYKCTVEEYSQRMSSSKVCQICSKETDLVYDHDHETMKFRGVLCRGCNRSIGQLGDTLESLMKAVDYLKGKNE